MCVMGPGAYKSSGRQNDDFYPTPPDVTEALMRIEKFSGPIWEPCCGDGALAKIIENHGYDVFGTDINPRGYGLKGNLFEFDYTYYNIITNPPFRLDNNKDVSDVIKHFMKFECPKIALLLKSTYWHAKSRLKIFDEYTPTWIYPLAWRPDFLLKGRPVMEVSWVVWERGNKEYPRYRPLPRPKII